MIYTLNRIELTLDCSTEKFNKLRSRAYDADYTLADDGLEIEYRDSTYKKKIRIIMNPVIFANDASGSMWNANSGSIQKMIRKLEKLIDRCFGSKCKLNDFSVTHISFTADIDVGSRKNVSAYIKVLRRIGKVKNFSPIQFKDYSHINNSNSFGLTGNSNGIEFIIFDKEAVSSEKDFKGIMGAEVLLTKQKTIRKYTGASTSTEQLERLAANAKEIFLDTFVHIVPYGDFIKKKEAVRIIEDSKLKRKSKNKMLRLLELIQKKKSLLLAQKAMNDRNIEKIMTMFYELNISPVVISKTQDVDYLDTLYMYLLDD